MFSYTGSNQITLEKSGAFTGTLFSEINQRGFYQSTFAYADLQIRQPSQPYLNGDHIANVSTSHKDSNKKTNLERDDENGQSEQ